jgi:hypothetical protein
VKNTSFGGFSTGPYLQDHPAVGGRCLDSGRFTAIFARLEFAELLYLARFEGKRPSIAAEWDWLAVVYIHKNCRSFRRATASRR